MQQWNNECWQEAQQEAQQWQFNISQKRVDEPSLGEICAGLTQFCNLPYWNRLWIVQEVLLAKNLKLCFGDDARTTCNWDLLSQARSSLERIPAYWNLDGCCKTMVEIIQPSLSFQLDLLKQGFDKGWPLHKLLEITKDTLCQDPRDKVYGLLGIAKDCYLGDIVIDYKKPVKDVFLDIIRWYYQNHESDDSYPSIVQFSGRMQLSFLTHNKPLQYLHNTGKAPLDVIGTLGSLPSETFCAKGTIKGPILNLERILDDSVLMALQRRDWIALVADYLDSAGIEKVKTCIENELGKLSSIKTSFAMKPSAIAYEGMVPGSTSVPSVQSDSIAHQNDNCSEDDYQFFMLSNGQFGIASNAIREGDMLCMFEDLQTALIVRRTTGDRLTLVSRAVLSQLCNAPSSENTTVRIHLDAASLQQLTRPCNISEMHTFRDPSFIHKADFGWYEFIKLGINTGAAPKDVSAGASKEETSPVAITVPELSTTHTSALDYQS